MARRSGNEWYVAVMNAGERRNVSVSLASLGINRVVDATLYYQASGKHPEVVNVKHLKVAKNGTITFAVTASTGAVLHLKVD